MAILSEAQRAALQSLIEKIRECCVGARLVDSEGLETLLHPLFAGEVEPIPMILHCPECKTRHVDKGDFATRVHHTHSCQGCGLTWRPAVVPTVGVQFLPGFKDPEP